MRFITEKIKIKTVNIGVNYKVIGMKSRLLTLLLINKNIAKIRKDKLNNQLFFICRFCAPVQTLFRFIIKQIQICVHNTDLKALVL